MGLRSAALTYMAGMGLLALAGASTIAYQAWSHLSDVDRTEALVRVLGPANRFVEAMALERGVHNQVLISREATSEEKHRLVAERVAMTDGVFEATFAGLSRLPDAEATPLREPVEEARRIIAAARQRAADALQGPVTDRSAEAARALVSEFVKATGVLDRTVIRLERALADKDPRLGLMMGVSRLSNEMREAAGQRSTILSRYAGTRQPHDPATVGKVAELTGAIKITWERMQRIVRQIGHSPRVEAAVEGMRATFFSEGERTYAEMAEAARRGAPPPMEFLAWRAWTVAMLTNTLGAREAPADQALEDIIGLKREARSRLAAALGAAGGAALIILAAALFFERRILRPIARLTSAIDRVTHEGVAERGSPQAASALDRAQYELRDDEIGSLARALNGFQQRTLELHTVNERFDSALASLPQGLIVFDANERVIVSNDRYAEIYRLKPEQVAPGTSLAVVLTHRVAAGSSPEHSPSFVAKSLEIVGRREPLQWVDQLSDGRAIAVRLEPMPGGGWVTTHEDITDRLKAQAQIAHMAHHDALTALPNRARFQDEIGRAASRVQRGESLAVLCLDLDQFKAVNDTLGHAAGDALLQAVADRLLDCVRDGDLVARLGGDEFAIVQAGAPQPVGATALARRVIDAIALPFSLDGQQVVIGVSVGIAVAPQDGIEPDQLLKSADLALYGAKADGRGVFRFFEREMDAQMQARRALELDLREALARGEFELYYQPVINLALGKVSRFEALLRWNHPTRGQVLPAEFVPLAEEIGLIVPIGSWVLAEACREAASWPSHIKVSVNLSAAQFRRRHVVLDVAAALGASGLQPSRLDLEITEAVLLLDTDATLETLHQLRELDVGISMDDFGTGYSSLNYLRRFPFDRIKIDRSFVHDLANGAGSLAIVRAVIGLSASLGLSTTAEGVETREQLQQLRSEGCTEVQGFLFSPPRPVREIPELIARDGCASQAA